MHMQVDKCIHTTRRKVIFELESIEIENVGMKIPAFN